MTAETLLNVMAQQTLWWFVAGLAGALAIGAVGALLQRHLAQSSPDKDGCRLPALAAGLALVLAAACVFAVLANGIAVEARIHRFDLLLSATLQEHASAGAYRFFSSITHFGDTITLTVLCIAGASTLLLLRRPLLALGLVAAIGGNSLLNPSLKAIFERSRPVHDEVIFDGWSFPSGHASGAVVAYGMLAWILLHVLPGRWHLPAILTAIAIIFSTGFSRIYLQAHYLSDVIAGFASGTAWLILCILGLELIRLRRDSSLAGYG